jgi:hypothetical protein
MSQLGVLFKHAGLCNIRAETKTLPVGSWGERIGRLLAQDMLSGWPRTGPLAQRVLGVPAEAFEQVMSQLETKQRSSRGR